MSPIIKNRSIELNFRGNETNNHFRLFSPEASKKNDPIIGEYDVNSQ